MKLALQIIVVTGLFIGLGIQSLLVGNALATEPIVIKMRTPSGTSTTFDPTKEYKYQLVQLILNKTLDSDGPFRIEMQRDWITQARTIDMVKQGYLSLIATMTSTEREQNLYPIRIPVFKGMYGYRLAIINKGDQERFTAVESLEDFQKLWAGQGAHWPDTKILRENGFKVVASSRFPELFEMLKERRFDFFPRGLHEPWKELSNLNDPDLAIEKDLCIHYPAPGYIFTAKENQKLADRIERGFRIALKDGSFDKLFYNHPSIKEVLKSARLKERRIFRIKNPLLSPLTPFDQENLWYHP